MPDTFHEVNGVAHTSRQFEAFTRRRQIPFLSIHCGPVRETVTDGEVTMMQLKRGPVRVALDANLDYDVFLLRYAEHVVRQLKKFKAEVVHVTGPGDMGTLGVYAAWRLNLPIVMSWHTSLHEYAGRRLERILRPVGAGFSHFMGLVAEKASLQILRAFYSCSRIVLAPNEELVQMMKKLVKRPVFLMQRGVETDLFTPARRTRDDKRFRIGYVGRLTPEKNVRYLAQLGKTLIEAGYSNFEFTIVGQGSEEEWLRQHVPHAKLTGVLLGERLAQAYADMDLFVFPSTTDTFGNVILEALASGVPAVVTSDGGPKFLVKSGETGMVATSPRDFIEAVFTIMDDASLHSKMCGAAREFALGRSWDSVFEDVFDAYSTCVARVPAVLSSRVHERIDPRWKEDQRSNLKRTSAAR